MLNIFGTSHIILSAQAFQQEGDKIRLCLNKNFSKQKIGPFF